MQRIQPRPPVVRLPPKSNFELLLSRGSQTAMIGLGVLGLIFALEAGQFLLAPVALAIIIGLMLGPVASRLERRGLVPVLSALVVVILFVLLVGALALALVTPLGYWAERLPQIWAQLQEQLVRLQQPLELLKNVRDEIRKVTGEGTMTVSVEDGSPVVSAATMAPAIGAQVLIFLASLYFFVATREQTRIAVLRLCTSRKLRWRVAHIFRDVEALVSRYLLSISAINLGLGVAVTIALWLIGVPQPALWGALAGLLNFVIYIGPAVMAALLFGVGLASFDSLAGSLMPPLVYLALNLIEGQFVTPTVIGRAMTLNPFVVFLALAFWLWIWGPVGGFIAIPALLIAFAVARNILPGMVWGAAATNAPQDR
jgi:predicted PurR-regulated permease PerM